MLGSQVVVESVGWPYSLVQLFPPTESMMKRKPDLVMALVLLFGIGVVATGYAQALAGS